MTRKQNINLLPVDKKQMTKKSLDKLTA